MVNEKKIIMRESDEAASVKTVTGWVSSDGRWWGDDENIARYAGCTHQLCECGQVVDKHTTRCNSCRRKDEDARFDALETKIWNGEEPIVLDHNDRYFFDAQDLLDYCYDEGVQPQDLRLRICEPQYGREIDDSYFCDELAEDGDVPDAIMEAMGVLNQAIKDSGPLSWYPSKYAAVIPDEYKVEVK